MCLLLVLLFVIMVWQHPLARAIGTESRAAVPAASAATLSVPPAAISQHLLPRRGSWHEIHHGSARNPFLPLLSTNGTPTAPTSLGTTPPGRTAHTGHGNGGAPAPRTRGPAPPTGGGCAVAYVVAPGQSLWAIAQAHLMSRGYASVTAAWHALYAANRATVGSDPDLLHVGERLCAPPTTGQD
jgi:hypothetical protein